jgi:hypothetical protein
MPLSTKFRRLRDLKRGPEGQPYPLSEIASEASRLYREQKISRITQELQAGSASMEEIAQACEEIRKDSDVVNRQYLTDLRDGKKSDVKWGVIEALSLFFKVKTDFWRIGADANAETRQAEKEVERIELGVQMVRLLPKTAEGDVENTQGMELVGALFRGAQEKDPAQVESILRLAVLALQAAPENPTG